MSLEPKNLYADGRPAIRKWLALALCLAGLALIYFTLVGVPVRSTIGPSAIIVAQVGSGEKSFTIGLRHWSALIHSDGIGAPEASTLRLFEDGRALGPAHSMHADIAALGGGRYSHWRAAIVFSSSDNSDPRTSGHAYSYTGISQLPIWFLLVGALCLAGALWLGRETVGAAIRSVARNPRLQLPLPLVVSASIILIAISLLWLFQLIIAARRDISQDDVLLLIGFCFLIIFIQALIMHAISKYVRFLFVFFGIVNAYSLFFVFSGDVTTYPFFVQLLLLFAMGAFYFMLFKLVFRFSGLRGWIVAGAPLCVAVVGIVGVVPIIAGPSSARSDVPEVPGIRVVEFTRHPNVYFLGFDGLMPARLTEKLLQVDDPAYIDVITKHGGLMIPNMFADQVPTKRFWATTMNILPVSRLDSEIVLGIEPSSVLTTFQHNGYDTFFSFSNAYFGPNKGPFLTSYAVSDPYSTCTFLDDLPKRYGFLGYCALRELEWLVPAPSIERWNEFYLDRLRLVTRDATTTPHFFASHYPMPAHTLLRYRRSADEFQEFREKYRADSRKAASIMDKMLAEIRSSDPTAIIFLFGDHGGYVSRGLNYYDDPEFVVRDLHGIMGVVFGAEACMPFLQPPEGERIQTSSRIVAGILQCLAGGESPLTVDHDFGRIHQAPDNMRFEDYAYE